jgi:NADP-dependent 3-hydroxy acid dehydrogenase YdfG
MTNPAVKAQILAAQDKVAISPNAIARAIAFAIDQPAEPSVGGLSDHEQNGTDKKRT